MSDDHAIIDVHAGDDLFPLAGTWEVDPTHSALEFVARYAMFTLVRGRFTSFSGTVVIDPPYSEATQIDVDIDASSVDTAMGVRDAQLRGDEFFDVERHPVISFRSRGATVLAAGRYTVHGELTIRGVAQPVRLVVDLLGRAPDVQGNPRLGLRATGKVQRSVWGITWNAPVPGGSVALADEVDLELDVSLVPAGAAGPSLSGEAG
jgi:polyisoprenoid-binding protein YceI